MEDYTGFIDQALQSFDTDDICDPTWLASVTADIDNYVEMIYSHDGNLQVENSTNESVIALSTISTVLDIPPYTPATNPSSGIEAAQKLLDISAASAPPTLAMSNIFTTFQAAPGAVIAPSSAEIRIKQTTHQGSRMSVPVVSPAQVGTREAPILIDDVMDEDIDQHDADGEFDLLIYAFG
ncbi:hypothetical protein PtrEW4_012144, partial [Pyrenophora tritici-repentis]